MRQREMIATEFDTDFYTQQFSLAEPCETDPILHYLQQGWLQNLDPSPQFSTSYYLGVHTDVVQCGMNPFLHYIEFGRAEKRMIADSTYMPDKAAAETANRVAVDRDIIAPAFDVAYYMAHSRDLCGLKLDPITHYLQTGWRELRDPCAEFSTADYLSENPDVKDATINPFVHYIQYGRAEGRPGRTGSALAAIGCGTLNMTAEELLELQKRIISPAFDPVYYSEQPPALLALNQDPIIHYLQTGWQQLRDPSPDFSTSYYLSENPDIEAAGMNPFLHFVQYGRAEGRSGQSYEAEISRCTYTPRVSVIVPNYNHGQFIGERLESILSQTYQPFEIIVLDDCSSDNSVDIINHIAAQNPGRIRLIQNTKNSGSVLLQWQKGIAACQGDLIWICESDDFCEPDFLEFIIPCLIDRSVLLAFGRIQYADRNGKIITGLDEYRERAEPGIWNDKYVRSAKEWFQGAFGVSNVIPNVGGCVFRNFTLPAPLWKAGLGYKILHDWYLYIILSEGGRIAYTPHAVAYFRQHGENTSVKSFRSETYYREHASIIRLLRDRAGVTDDIVIRFGQNLYKTYQFADAAQHIEPLGHYFSFDETLRRERRATHILMAFLGFHLGGGEMFPIHLANELLRHGYIVTMLCMDSSNENAGVRAMLDSRIAVFEARQVKELGMCDFLARLGIDVIHSHNIGVEFFFYKNVTRQIPIPYIVTMHGAYEVTPTTDEFLHRATREVTHWVYLSKKNLSPFEGFPLRKAATSFIGNGMPHDSRPFPRGRAALGIGDDDLVFTIVSRAIPEKGWEAAIKAVLAAQPLSSRKLVLMLCGSGTELDRLKDRYGNETAIHFMGFQDRISGIYRLSDCALLPSRFRAESFPLTLIQAMQAGTPIIATSVGEIERMMVADGLRAGLVIDPHDEDEVFVPALTSAILAMGDDGFRGCRAADAARLGQNFEMNNVTESYKQIYQRVRQHDPVSQTIINFPKAASLAAETVRESLEISG
jgi:glycosyltransferase involved in cell wall biosynthesis